MRRHPVDARFTLAAERTVLAWIRTALGFMAGGVGIVFIAPQELHPALELGAGLLMVVVGAGIALLGAYRWRRTAAALETDGELPGPLPVLGVIAAIVVVAVLIAVVIIVGG
ncbi:YidH family protein [Gordonia soli]|uniref:DUF202 domain-containing protein n=1 Tax=Gordonia soli NBRC 108243 TaxID=1223545 RepID=M0QGI7_9ACTN|nr:DUF202 domain-containing protein [Gordonia soli]GAC67564.1 hypothetical protein GS4_08_01490 [Gordonia soli NBRC 108243]